MLVSFYHFFLPISLFSFSAPHPPQSKLLLNVVNRNASLQQEVYAKLCHRPNWYEKSKRGQNKTSFQALGCAGYSRRQLSTCFLNWNEVKEMYCFLTAAFIILYIKLYDISFIIVNLTVLVTELSYPVWSDRDLFPEK